MPAIDANSYGQRRLFLSYGHRDATELALRLRADLETAGYPVWQDEQRIRAAHSSTDEIRQGLRESNAVVALLSPHSVRRKGWTGNPDDQDSVCLDEIEYAVDACKVPVLPVMAQACEPPFRIFRISRHFSLSGVAVSPDATGCSRVCRTSSRTPSARPCCSAGHLDWASRRWLRP